MARRKYSIKQRIAFAFGRGSALGTSAKGREKHVRAVFKTDEEVLSYKQGRKYEMDRKKAYLSSRKAKKTRLSGANGSGVNVVVNLNTSAPAKKSKRYHAKKNLTLNKKTGEVKTSEQG